MKRIYSIPEDNMRALLNDAQALQRGKEAFGMPTTPPDFLSRRTMEEMASKMDLRTVLGDLEKKKIEIGVDLIATKPQFMHLYRSAEQLRPEHDAQHIRNMILYAKRYFTYGNATTQKRIPLFVTKCRRDMFEQSLPTVLEIVLAIRSLLPDALWVEYVKK